MLRCHDGVLSVACCLALGVGFAVGYDYDWGLFDRMYPEFRNITCYDRADASDPARAEVPCKEVPLLGFGWQTGPGPIFAWPAQQFMFERVIGLVNQGQALLPGYKVKAYWKDDKWDPFESVRVMAAELARANRTYVAVLQGSDISALQINAVAAANRLPHFGFHIDTSMSDREKAPWYFRTTTANQYIYEFLFQVFQYMNWTRYCMIAEPAYSVDAAKAIEFSGDANVPAASQAFYQEISQDTIEIVAPVVSEKMRNTRLRVLFMWTDFVTTLPVACQLVLDNVAKVTVIEAPGDTWWTRIPELPSQMHAEHMQDGGLCSMDRLASWAEGELALSPKFNDYSGVWGGPPRPFECLPGESAASDLTRWWMVEFGHHFPQSYPVFGAGDCACMIVKLFRHILFELNRPFGFLSSRTQEMLDVSRVWLENIQYTKGLVHSVRFRPGLGDIEPYVVIYQVQKKVDGRPGAYGPTRNEFYDMYDLGDLPGAWALADLSILAETDRHETCFNNTLRVATATELVSGHFEWSSHCAPCPAGTRLLKDSKGLPSCIDCPVGFFSESGQIACDACPAGSFAASRRQSECSKCELGKYQPDFQQLNYVSCPAGSYMADVGATQCIACDVGSYSEAVGQTRCEQCPDGLTTATPGVADMTGCVCIGDPDRAAGRGTFRDCGGGPEGCSLNATRPTTKGFCSPCPLGMLCVGPQTSPLAMVSEGGQHRMPTLEARTMAIGSVVYACPGDGSACPGAFMGSAPSTMCSAGGSGVGCALCAPGWHFSESKCAPCGGDGGPGISGPVLVAAAAIIGAVCIVAATLPPEPYGTFVAGDLQRRRRNALLATVGTVVLQTAQTLSVFGVTAILWPPGPKEAMIAPNALFSLSVMKFGCNSDDPRIAAVTETAVKNALPLFPFLLLALCFLASKALVNPGSKWVPSDHQCVAMSFSIFSMFFLTLSNSAANAGFSQISHPGGTQSLKMYPFLLVGSSEASTIKAISAVGATVWCAGGLACVVYALHQLPRRVSDNSFRMRTLPLVIQWKPDRPWWFLVALMRSLFVALTSTLFETPELQIAYLSLVLTGYSFGLLSFKPHYCSICFYAELVATCGQVFVLLSVIPGTKNGATAFVWLSFVLTYAALAILVVSACFVAMRMTMDPDETRNLDQQFMRDLGGRIAAVLPTTGGVEDLLQRLSGISANESPQGEADETPKEAEAAEAWQGEANKTPKETEGDEAPPHTHEAPP